MNNSQKRKRAENQTARDANFSCKTLLSKKFWLIWRQKKEKKQTLNASFP